MTSAASASSTARAAFWATCAGRHAGCGCLAPAFAHDDVTRLDVIRAQAVQLRELGFDGAVCMHPLHLETISEVFSPSAAEARAALELLRDFTAAANGRLIERVHVTVARKTLVVARELGLVDAAEFEATGVAA